MYIEVARAKVVDKTNMETSKTNPNVSWRTVIVDTTTNPQYPEKLAFKFIGKNFAMSDNVNVGQFVSIGGFVSSREYQGKYYTDLNGLKVTVLGDETSQVRDDSNAHVDIPNQPIPQVNDGLPF